MAINPKHVAALDGKGLVLDALGNYTGALAYFDKALAIDPNNKHTLFLKQLAQYALHATTGNATSFLEYENSTYGIKMKYPSTWIKEESHNPRSNNVTFDSPEGTSPSTAGLVR